MSSAFGSAFGVCEGDVVAGKYRIDKILGTGGMGVVVAAHHLQLDDRVAIKLLHPESLQNKDVVARFAREARAAVRIKSEHVARVIDVGTLDSGAPYMVMEYLDGADLQSFLRQTGPLSVEQAAEFLLQACEAIAEAHALGIVHRDLKPENLFVIRRPDDSLCVKVLDFGISKARAGSAHSGESTTSESVLMGSPLYMSPEQLRSAKDVDARSDIWAIGVVLFELLTLSMPFSAATIPELVTRVLSEPPLDLRDLRPDVPKGLEAVVARCLEKDRDQRYAHVGQLAAALLPFAPARSRASVDRISGVMKKVSGVTPQPIPAATPVNDPLSATISAITERPPVPFFHPSSRAMKLAIGLALVVAVAVAVVLGITPESTKTLPVAPPESPRGTATSESIEGHATPVVTPVAPLAPGPPGAEQSPRPDAERARSGSPPAARPPTEGRTPRNPAGPAKKRDLNSLINERR